MTPSGRFRSGETQVRGGDGRCAPASGGCSLDAVRGYHATLTLVRERCRADALLIRVKTVQSEPFFANTANTPLSSQLDIIQERGGGPCKGTALRSRVGGRKKARRAMPWGRIG